MCVDKVCPVCGQDGFASPQAYAGHISKHSSKHYIFTAADRQRGGQATMSLPVPKCPHCRRRRPFKSRAEYVGHMGLHGLARRLGCSLRQAARQLAAMGFAITDPAPWNGASRQGQRLLESFGHYF